MQSRTADTFTDSFAHASPMRRMTPIWGGGNQLFALTY
jgi:hypothetical protein